MKHSRRIFRKVIRLMAVYVRWKTASTCQGSKAF